MNASIRRSFDSVGDISANSLSRSDGVARMSLMSVLQKTTLPAPIMAIFLGMVSPEFGLAFYQTRRRDAHVIDVVRISCRGRKRRESTSRRWGLSWDCDTP